MKFFRQHERFFHVNLSTADFFLPSTSTSRNGTSNNLSQSVDSYCVLKVGFSWILFVRLLHQKLNGTLPMDPSVSC